MKCLRLVGAALALGWLGLVSACGGGEVPPEAQRPAEADAAPSEAQRIVALAPSLVEVLYTLGLGDRVVGVGSYTTWPPEAEGLPRLGGLYDPNLEGIVALDPDLVVLVPSQRELGEALSRLSIDVLEVESETLEDVERALVEVAARCGVQEIGEREAERFRSALAPRSLSDTPRVLLSIGREAGRPARLLSAGPGTFLDQLLTRLGAENVFADAGLPYPEVGLEEVLARRPDVIIELSSADLSAEVVESLLEDWRRVEALAAEPLGAVRVIAGGHTLLPGPRLPRLYRELMEAIGGASDDGA